MIIADKQIKSNISFGIDENIKALKKKLRLFFAGMQHF
jgi:hypothetical protein